MCYLIKKMGTTHVTKSGALCSRIRSHKKRKGLTYRTAHSELKLILLVWAVMILKGSQVFTILK